MAFDIQKLKPTEYAALGATVLGIVFSFIPGYLRVGISFLGIDVHASVNAWHSWGAWGTVLFLLAAVVWSVLFVLEKKITLGSKFSLNVVLGAVAALATLISILRLVTFSSSTDGLGHAGWAGWVLTVLELVFIVAVFLLARDGGEIAPALQGIKDAAQDIAHRDETPEPPADPQA